MAAKPSVEHLLETLARSSPEDHRLDELPEDGARPDPSLRRRTMIPVLIALILICSFAAQGIFNVRSNIVVWATQTSTAPLEVRLGGGRWIPVERLQREDISSALRTLHDGDVLTVHRLEVRRRAASRWRQIIAGALGSELIVLRIDPSKANFATSFRNDFEPTTAVERLRETPGAVLALPANYFDRQGRPIGWVVHQSKERNRALDRWTGFFFVADGKPYFGPHSLLAEVRAEKRSITEAAQAFPSVMRDGVIFSYVRSEPERYFQGLDITYRSLAGVDAGGHPVMLLSGSGGGLNITEAALIARALGVEHATLLDGGTSLQYAIRESGFWYRFGSFNHTLELPGGRLGPVRSPVFIVASLAE